MCAVFINMGWLHTKGLKCINHYELQYSKDLGDSYVLWTPIFQRFRWFLCFMNSNIPKI